MKTTHSVWEALDGELLKGIKALGRENSVLIDVSCDTDDGTYPTVKSYRREVLGMDDEGTSYWINRLTRKKDKTRIELSEYSILREKSWEEEAVLEFKEPVNVLLAEIGEEQIIRKIKKVKGRFDHDYFWTKGGRQSELANGFEVWFSIEEYLE